MRKAVKILILFLTSCLLLSCARLPITFHGKSFPEYLLGVSSEDEPEPHNTSIPSVPSVTLQKRWILESFNGNICPDDECLDVHRFYLVLEDLPSQGNTFPLEGITPGNKFWGSYTFDSLGAIQIYDVSTTRHYLPQPLSHIETRFLDIMENTDYYEISESQLWLFSNEEVLIFRAVPDYQLRNRSSENEVE